MSLPLTPLEADELLARHQVSIPDRASVIVILNDGTTREASYLPDLVTRGEVVDFILLSARRPATDIEGLLDGPTITRAEQVNAIIRSFDQHTEMMALLGGQPDDLAARLAGGSDQPIRLRLTGRSYFDRLAAGER